MCLSNKAQGKDKGEKCQTLLKAGFSVLFFFVRMQKYFLSWNMARNVKNLRLNTAFREPFYG